MIMLACCRALQGLGAGSILTLGFTIIADVYPPRERARALAVVSVVWGMAAVAGAAARRLPGAHGGLALRVLGQPAGRRLRHRLHGAVLHRDGTAPGAPDRRAGRVAAGRGQRCRVLALLQMHELGLWAIPLLVLAAALLLLLAAARAPCRRADDSAASLGATARSS